MRRRPGAACAAGFTLVEVLVAVAILAVAMAIVAGSFAGTLRVLEAADRRTELTHTARTALDRVVQDLASAFVPGGAAGAPSLPFVVEDRELTGAPRDRLTFATYGRPLGTAELASDRALVEYELVVSDDRRDWRLVRRQVSRPPLDPARLAEAPADVLAEGLVGFDVRLLDDKREWKTSWNDGAKLPLAVEVTLTVAADPERAPLAGREAAAVTDARTYGTRVVLPLARKP